MPESNETKVTPAVDPSKDLKEKLEAELLASLKAENEGLKKDLKAAEHRVDMLEKKLKAAKSAPMGDVVYLNGVSHSVVKTVRANHTFDEVKKGYVPEGCTLVVIEAPH